MKISITIPLLLLTSIISTKSFPQSGLPVLTIKSITGNSVSFSSVIDNNTVTIISFWATWCVPCINELDALQEKLEEKKKQSFQLIAISTDEARTVQKVRPLVKSRGWAFEIYLDESNEIKRAFNVSNIPFVIIVSKGKIVYQKSGYTQGDEDILLEKINQLTIANHP